MHSNTEKLLHFTKVKANRIAKETMAGPGKFGVFIFFCILIVGIHDGFYYLRENNQNECCDCFRVNNNLDNKQKIKEIFPQTHDSNAKENKNKKMLYMNVIKRNQSMKENEEYSDDLHYYQWQIVENVAGGSEDSHFYYNL